MRLLGAVEGEDIHFLNEPAKFFLPFFFEGGIMVV